MSNPSTYFWRDRNGRIEVDCIVDRGDALFPVEIKSGETISPSFFSSLATWNDLAKRPQEQSHDHLWRRQSAKKRVWQGVRDRTEITFTVIEEKNGSDLDDFSESRIRGYLRGKIVER